MKSVHDAVAEGGETVLLGEDKEVLEVAGWVGSGGDLGCREGGNGVAEEVVDEGFE